MLSERCGRKPDPGRPEKVIGIAASAGGIHALAVVLSGLREDLAAPVLVVQHMGAHQQSVLPHILQRQCRLHVKQAEQDEALWTGIVYVAPPDRHLTVTAAGTVLLTHAAQVHFLRPAADVLFESLAQQHGKDAVAVVLSGSGSDGAAGVRAIKKAGGTVIAQDKGAEFYGMPGAAIATGQVDLVLPLGEIAEALQRLVAKGGSV